MYQVLNEVSEDMMRLYGYLRDIEVAARLVNRDSIEDCRQFIVMALNRATMRKSVIVVEEDNEHCVLCARVKELEQTIEKLEEDIDQIYEDNDL
jgi:hypothetical protein